MGEDGAGRGLWNEIGRAPTIGVSMSYSYLFVASVVHTIINHGGGGMEAAGLGGRMGLTKRY